MRSGCSSGSIWWVLLVWGRFCASKTIIPEHGSTFSPPQHGSPLISSVDWGLDTLSGIRAGSRRVFAVTGPRGRSGLGVVHQRLGGFRQMAGLHQPYEKQSQVVGYEPLLVRRPFVPPFDVVVSSPCRDIRLLGRDVRRVVQSRTASATSDCRGRQCVQVEGNRVIVISCSWLSIDSAMYQMSSMYPMYGTHTGFRIL